MHSAQRQPCGTTHACARSPASSGCLDNSTASRANLERPRKPWGVRDPRRLLSWQGVGGGAISRLHRGPGDGSRFAGGGIQVAADEDSGVPAGSLRTPVGCWDISPPLPPHRSPRLTPHARGMLGPGGAGSSTQTHRAHSARPWDVGTVRGNRENGRLGGSLRTPVGCWDLQVTCSYLLGGRLTPHARGMLGHVYTYAVNVCGGLTPHARGMFACTDGSRTVKPTEAGQ